MDTQEALNEIKSRMKPYAQIGMPQSTFANTVRNIEVGLAKQTTIDEFMEKFGYQRKEIKWLKK